MLDLLLRPDALGDGISVVTHTSGPDGGYDTLSLGTGPIPLDGPVGLRPVCLEASLSADPYLVPRLVENGQTLRDVEAPGSWQGGAAFAPDAQTLEALRAWVSVADEDGDGRVSLPAEVNLFEDGVVIGQRPDLQLALDGDQVQLALRLGITRRGYEVLRAIDLDATGDATIDAWLTAASDAFVEAMPPFRSGRKAGLLLGDAIGACATALISASPAPDDSPRAGRLARAGGGLRDRGILLDCRDGRRLDPPHHGLHVQRQDRRDAAPHPARRDRRAAGASGATGHR